MPDDKPRATRRNNLIKINAHCSIFSHLLFYGWRLQAGSLGGVISVGLPVLLVKTRICSICIVFVFFCIVYFDIFSFLYFRRLQAGSPGAVIPVGLTLLVVKTSICSIVHSLQFFNKLSTRAIHSKYNSQLMPFQFKTREFLENKILAQDQI